MTALLSSDDLRVAGVRFRLMALPILFRFTYRFGNRFGYNQVVSKLEISLFGPPKIGVDGVEYVTERRKSTAILAYLAVTGKQQMREHLAAFFWPEYERNSAFSYLRREIYEINKNLGKGWLITDRRTVRLNFTEKLQLDVRLFEQLIANSRSAENPVPLLAQAIDAYQGHFLDGFYLQDTEPYENWQRQQEEHYRREYAAALERFSALHEQEGIWETALQTARRWLALDELNETAHRAMMRIFAGMGERSRAIRQFEMCRQQLKVELDVSPQTETVMLYERIAHDQFEAPISPASTIQENPGDDKTQKLHLPVLTTPFIGRRPEMEQLKEQILHQDNRLVTLLGPGGTGKTRLSIRAVSELGQHFNDGIWFVPLAPVQTAEGALQAIAKSINFSFQRDEEPAQRQLLDYLRRKKMLLVLDNVEQLVGADMGQLLLDILTNADQLKLVITTRVRLNIPGEQLFMVSGMRFPTPAEAVSWADPESQSRPYSAMQLFIDRGRRVQPSFQLSIENAGPVAEICSLVHGLPLGLELAASWLELLPPEEIVAEIQRSMDFLESNQPGVPERQRSIRAVFDYSWKLLNEIEKEAFLSLSVFVGSFTSEAGRNVGRTSLRTLLSLVNKSWMQQDHENRFQLHPLLQLYAQERLDEDRSASNAAHDRHARFFADFVYHCAKEMRSANQVDALSEFKRDFQGDIWSAWSWLVQTSQWEILKDKMLAGMFHFGVMSWLGPEMVELMKLARTRLEAEPEMKESLTYIMVGAIEVYFEESWGMIENQPDKRLQLLWALANKKNCARELGVWYIVLGSMYLVRTQDETASPLLEEQVRHFKSTGQDWAYGYAILTMSNFWDGLLVERSEHRIREALEIFESLGTSYELAVIYRFLGVNASARNDPLGEVVELLENAQWHYLQLGDHFGSGVIEWTLADHYFMHGEPDLGIRSYQEMRRIFTELGVNYMIGNSLSWESLWTARYSDMDLALKTRRQSLAFHRANNLQFNEAWDVFELADVYRIFGDIKTASKLYDQARRDFNRIKHLLGLGYISRAQGDLALLEGNYSEALDLYAAFRKYALEDNHQWSVMQADTRSAMVMAYQGNVAAARETLRICFDELRGTANLDLMLAALLAEVRCLMGEENDIKAAEIAGFISEYPHTWNELRFQAAGFLDELAAVLSEERFAEAVSKYDDWEVEAVIAACMDRY